MVGSPFSRAAQEHRAAFIAYLLAGDPDLVMSERMATELGALGVDMIEIGVPFSDPLADGPTIAGAAARALANNVGIEDVLALASRCHHAAPIVLLSYYNPVLQFGVETFASRAAEAGAAAVIIPDLAADGVDFVRRTLHNRGLAMPRFVAPTTTEERLRSIVASATGFIYVVSRLGVTGLDRQLEVETLARRVASLRQLTSTPLVVGFGIRTAADVHEISRFADGVIVGSALIDAYTSATTDPVAALTACVRPLLASTAKNESTICIT